MRRLVVALAIAIISAVGCSSSPDEPAADGETIDAVPFPSTAVLGEDSAALVETVAAEGQVRFRSMPPELAAAKAGTVFVSGSSPAAPSGLLRVVLAVHRDGDAVVLDTLPAMPQLAYKKLHVTARRSGLELDADAFQPSPGLEPLSGGLSSQARIGRQQSALGKRVPLDILVFDGDGNRDTVDDQIRIVGGLEARIDFDADLSFDWGAIDDLPGAVKNCLESLPGILVGQLPRCTPLELLPELKARFDATPRGILDVNVEGGASLSYQRDLTLGTIPGPPIPLGPVVLRPTLEIRAGVLGEASARFTTGVDAELAITTGVTASTRTGFELRPPTVSKFEVQEKPTELALFARGRVHLGARLTLALWEIVGPYAEIRGFGELTADATRTPCYSLVAGLEALFGLKISTPELPVIGAATLFDIEAPPMRIAETELASGSCAFPADARMPGQGPDSRALANPTAPRWQSPLVSGLAAPLVEGAPLRASQGRIDLARTVDGEIIALVAGTSTVVKLDGSGAVRWTRETPNRLFDMASGKDGTFRLLSRDFEGGDFTLTEMGQRGQVGRTWKYTFPRDLACTGPEPRRVSGLSNGDYAVVVYCANGPALVAQVAPDGRVRHANALTVPEGNLDPSALAAKGGDLLVSGQLRPGAVSGDLFVTRLDEQLSPRWAKRYRDCDEARGLVPSQMRETYERDELVVVGGTGVGGGFFVRLTPAGDVAFASFPWLGIAASAHFVANDVVELPQTGYLLTGTGVRLLDPEPTRRTAARLVRLDGAGRPMATVRYGAPTGHTGYPGIVLGDDGGFVLAALEAETGSNGQGRLLGLAGFAKDGSTDGALFAPGDEPPLAEAACTLVASPSPLDVTPLSLGWRLAR